MLVDMLERVMVVRVEAQVLVDGEVEERVGLQVGEVVDREGREVLAHGDREVQGLVMILMELVPHRRISRVAGIIWTFKVGSISASLAAYVARHPRVLIVFIDVNQLYYIHRP